VFRAIGKSVVTGEVDIVMQIILDYEWISEHKLMSLIWRDVDSFKFENVINTICRTGLVSKIFKGPNGESGIWYRSNRVK
jgi:hypothetical protein